MGKYAINKENQKKKEVKTSKNYTLDKKFLLVLLDYIKNNNKLPDLDMSKQALNYHIKKLKVSNIIYKTGYSTWSVDYDKYEQFKFRKQVKIMPKVAKPTEIEKLTKKTIRSHGFVFTLKLPNIQNWNYRETYLIKHKIPYKNIGIHNNTQSITFRSCKIWLCSKTIVIYFPKDKSYFDINAENGKNYAIYNLESILKGLEIHLNVDLKIKHKYEFKVSRQHYANINNSLAMQYNKNGRKLNIYNKGGLWFIIDNSFNLNEAETIDPNTADKDMDKVVMPFFNDLKDHYDTTGESLTMSGMLNIINGLIKLNVQEKQNNYPTMIENNNINKKKLDYIG